MSEPLRIGVLSTSGSGREPDADVRAGLDGAVKLLESLGHKASVAKWPVDSARFGQDFLTLWSAGAAMDIEAMAKALGHMPTAAEAEPFSLGMAELIAKAPEGTVDAAIGRLAQASAAYDAWFASTGETITS